MKSGERTLDQLRSSGTSDLGQRARALATHGSLVALPLGVVLVLDLVLSALAWGAGGADQGSEGAARRGRRFSAGKAAQEPCDVGGPRQPGAALKDSWSHHCVGWGGWRWGFTGCR